MPTIMNASSRVQQSPQSVTRLQQTLAGDTRPTVKDAFDFALARFLEGEKVDLKAIVETLGIDRTTLFRWVGNRKDLLTEINWHLAEHLIDRLIEQTPGAGPERIGAIVGGFAQTLVDSAPFNAFLRREPETALHVLTRGPLQQRMIDKIEDQIERETSQGNLVPRMPHRDLAYLIIRIGESFIYTDLIIGGSPSPQKAELAVTLLLESQT